MTEAKRDERLMGDECWEDWLDTVSGLNANDPTARRAMQKLRADRAARVAREAALRDAALAVSYAANERARAEAEGTGCEIEAAWDEYDKTLAALRARLDEGGA